MNERVMQFRIGIFVIVAGLVLAMMLIWFGESPSLFREHSYVTVRYNEAPGVAEGIPIRKSGIRVGEVADIRFEDRPGQPDGVLVTLSIDRKYKDKIKTRPVPRIARGLIGDVTIELVPGPGSERFVTSEDPAQAPVIMGEEAADPAKALQAAAEAFEKAGDTLHSIELAAEGVAGLSKKAEGVETFLSTWSETGVNLNRVIRENEANLQPALAKLRSVSQKVDDTLDPPTLARIRSGTEKLASASDRLDTLLSDLSPVAKDLGGKADTLPRTSLGWVLYRFNRIAYDTSLFTRHLSNPDGSLMKMVKDPELSGNLNAMALTARDAFSAAKPVLRNLNIFAEKIARNPAILAEGALRRP